MSVLTKLDRKTFSNLSEILEIYETKMEGWEENVKIDGKNIEVANIEQPSWLAYYDQIKVELRALLDFFDMKVKERRGLVDNIIRKNSSLDLNEKTRILMVDCDSDYLKIYQIYLLVKEAHGTAEMIVNNIAQRAYTLTNLVKIRTAGVENITLYINDR